MVRENQQITTEARDALTGNWNKGALVVLIIFFIPAGLQALLTEVIKFNPELIQSLVTLFLSAPFTLGLAIFFLNLAKNTENNPPKITQCFHGFERFWDAIFTEILLLIYILLQLLLLIVPGIMAMFSYSLTFYVMADNPTVSGNQAIQLSKQIMKGHRFKLFMLVIRFIPWALLGVMAFGIGLLWVGAYFHTSIAKFYEDVKVSQQKVVN